MKKLLKILLYAIGSIISILLIFAIFLWIKSPGKTPSIKGDDGEKLPGSITSIEQIKIGGIDQYLIIRGADSTKPVMLFLHGGPGSPEIAFMREYNPDIENDYIMVYWEQRGAGKSYSSDIPVESMNIGQFVLDTKELSQMLIKRFNKEKIYLMGHSWGSMLGILTAHHYPELFYAYFGIGQVCDQYQGEKIGFEWVKHQAMSRDDKQAIRKLDEIKFPDKNATIDEWGNYLMAQRKYVTKYGGGVTFKTTSMWPVLKLVLNAPEYTFSEKTKGLSASLFSLENLWVEIVNTNLFERIDSLEIPVYIMHGKHDFTTPYSIAKDFHEQLKAPEKGFYTFESSAHSPCLEEAEKFNKIVKELVGRYTPSK
jgi:pimeloyl-ACP methyl ester carboxylesterase